MRGWIIPSAQPEESEAAVSFEDVHQDRGRSGSFSQPYQRPLDVQNVNELAFAVVSGIGNCAAGFRYLTAFETAASGVSAVLGQMVDAIIIATMVVLSIGLNFFQAYPSERAVRRLRELVTNRNCASRRKVGRIGAPRAGAR